MVHVLDSVIVQPQVRQVAGRIYLFSWNSIIVPLVIPLTGHACTHATKLRSDAHLLAEKVVFVLIQHLVAVLRWIAWQLIIEAALLLDSVLIDLIFDQLMIFI